MRKKDQDQPVIDVIARFSEVEDQIVRMRNHIKKYEAENREELNDMIDNIESLQRSINTLNEAVLKFGKGFGVLEKKITSLRTDSSAGLVSAIVICTILFVLAIIF